MSYYQCLECGYIFSSREKAEQHWRADVTGEHSTSDYIEKGEHIGELE